MATPIPENGAAFTIEELQEALRAQVLHRGAVSGVYGVSTDTRSDLRHKAFVALRGERFDAHDYLPQAADAGAAVLIVSDCAQTRAYLREAAPTAPWVLGVVDPLDALADLARAHRKRWGGRIVAVAGSAGKTTTRAACSALLAQIAPSAVHSTRGNLNNRIGVPLTLLGLLPQHRFAAVEVGTNSPGEVRALASTCLPNVAILTLIDLEHTEGLGDLDGVEKEEREIFSFLGPTDAALGFAEDVRVDRSVRAAPCDMRLGYGFEPGVDLRIEHRELLAPDRMRLVVRRASGECLAFESSLVGRPGALAAAAAVLGVETLTGQRVTQDAAERALATVGEPGRHSIVELSGPIYVVDDSYNANPVSVQNSLQTAREVAKRVGGRLWLVLGEMLELGALSSATHLQMGQLAAESGAEGAFFVQGDAQLAAESARRSGLKSHFHETSQEVAPVLAQLLRERDVVLIKGSRGVRVERVLEGLAATWPRKTETQGTPLPPPRESGDS